MRTLALVIASSITLFSGCSITGHTPMTRFESPETRGETWKLEAQGAYQGRNEISLTPDFTLWAPSLASPSIESPDHRVMVSGAMGVAERVDLSISVPETRIGVKWQPFGETRKDAGTDNFPVAIYTGFSYNEEDESNRSLFSGANATNATYNLRELNYDIGLVLGFRPAKNLLIYGGPFMVWKNLSTRHKPSLSAPETEQEATARVYNVNLGLQVDVDERLFTRIEGAAARTELGNAQSTKGTWGVSLGAYF